MTKIYKIVERAQATKDLLERVAEYTEWLQACKVAELKENQQPYGRVSKPGGADSRT